MTTLIARRSVANPGLHRRRPILAAATLGVALLLVGCDNESVETKAAREETRRAAALVQAGDVDTAITSLESATGRDSARPAAKAQAQQLLGFAKQLKGREALAEAATAQAEADRITFEVIALIDAIRAGNNLIDEMRNRNPVPTLEQIDTIQANIAGEGGGGGGGGTWTIGDVELPTLAALRQDISRLEGEIARLEEEQSTQQQESESREQTAAEGFEEANRTGGSSSVATFNEAVEAQRTGELARLAASRLELELLPLRQDLALAKAREQQLSQTREALADLRAVTEENWSQVEANIAAQQQALQTLFASEPGEEDTMVSASVQSRSNMLQQKLDEVADAADTADQSLAAASQSFSAAASASSSVVPATPGGTVVVARSAYDLQAGAAEYDRGILHVILSNGQAVRLQAAEAIAAAAEQNSSLTPPAPLQLDATRTELQSSIESATNALVLSNESTEQARSGRSTGVDADVRSAVSRSAALLTAVSNYALAQVSELAAETGLNPDGMQQAQNYLAAGREALADVENVQSLGLPAALLSDSGAGGRTGGQSGQPGARGAEATPPTDAEAEAEADPDPADPADEVMDDAMEEAVEDMDNGDAAGQGEMPDGEMPEGEMPEGDTPTNETPEGQ